MYVLRNSRSHGVSILQGPHQVAQKFSRTALPRRSDSRMLLPSSDCKVKSGAGPDLVMGGGAGPERRAIWKPKYSMAAATTATTAKASGLRFPPLAGPPAEAATSYLPPSTSDSGNAPPHALQVTVPTAAASGLGRIPFSWVAQHFGQRQ